MEHKLELDSDILYSIIAVVAASDSPRALKNVSLASRLLREIALPTLFSEVKWPHADKHSEEGGLAFFPEGLWRHFRKLSLIWPEHWTDSTPPLWGDRYYPGGDYHPRHLEKLTNALPNMPLLASFHMTCPFYPPSALFNALIQCRSIKTLSMSDTPLYNVGVFSSIPEGFHLERISIVPVAEALRLGEGSFDPKYSEISYYTRDYRRKYKNDSLARYAADGFLFTLGKASCLRSVQISGDLCDLASLAKQEWPNLTELILTGHVPRGGVQPGGVELVDVVGKMPKLVDLRLLFATVKNDPLFRVLPSQVVVDSAKSEPTHVTPLGTSARILSQLRYLALSNACHLTSAIFHYADKLERLVVCAISDLPRVPVALGRADIDALLSDPAAEVSAAYGAASASAFSMSMLSSSPSAQNSPISSSNTDAPPYPSLKLLRIMIEDKVHPELCARLARIFPSLEDLEVELCGYHDGKSVYAWEEFGDALGGLRDLKKLRVCLQFPEFDSDADIGGRRGVSGAHSERGMELWRNARKECAAYFAGRIPSLEVVGFEHRKRTGTHRYEDSWLEYQVERRVQGADEGGDAEVGVQEQGPTPTGYASYHLKTAHGHHHPFSGMYQGRDAPNGGDVVDLEELPPSWFKLPEVWTPEYLPGTTTSK